MKIAYVGLKTFPPKYGGYETMTYSIVNEVIKDRAFEAIVFPFSSDLGEVRSDRLDVVPLGNIKIPYLRSIFSGLLSLSKIRKEKPDLVHLNGIENAYLIPFLKILDKKVVLNVRGTKWAYPIWEKSARALLKIAPIFLGSLFLKLNVRFFAKKADLVVTVNDAAIAELPRKASSKALVVYNSLSIREPECRELLTVLNLPPTRYLLFIGRIIPLKGLHYLIRAYNELDYDFPIVVVGEMKKNDAYHSYLRRISSKKVRFVGGYFGKDAYSLIRNSLLTILPSTTEGMSVTILEAAILKAPILVSDIKENTVLWGDAVHYFSSGDVQDLRRKISILIDDKAIRMSKIDAAYRLSNTKFNFDEQISKLKMAYSSLATHT